MNDLTMDILKLIASFLTPLIILILGIAINRRLESAKATLSKEKDWQNWWASQFLSVCHDYSSNITDIVAGLYHLEQINEEKLSGWENELNEKISIMRQSLRNLQYLEWEIQNCSQFAQEHGTTVIETGKKLYALTGSLIDKKQGNIEDIRQSQFEFNSAVRAAHAEILGLSLTKRSSGRS